MGNPSTIVINQVSNLLGFTTYRFTLPTGSIYTTILELGTQHHNRNGLLVPNSIMVVHMGGCPN